MAALVVRIALGVLATGFLGWWLYITILGLKVFFGTKAENVEKPNTELGEK